MKTSGISMPIGMRRAAWALAAAALTACSSLPPSAPAGIVCPYAPWYGHAYRHGAVPTREAQRQILAWKAARREAQAAVSPATLVFGGGVDGIGVTSGVPRVYLVFYGSQWTSGGDPGGAATYLQHLFQGLGTGGEQWSGTMTQYCDGPTVARGASSCTPANTPHVGYPDGGALAGVWFDGDAAAPDSATGLAHRQNRLRYSRRCAISHWPVSFDQVLCMA
jgi:serine protease